MNNKKIESRSILTRAISILLLAVILATTLVSCGNSPVKPTKEEAQVVMKIGSLDVTYDLFRYMFLTYKGDIDKGDNSVWSSSDADKYWQQAMDKIVPILCERYASLDLAIANGVDIYGKTIEEAIQAYVDVAIDGNTKDVTVNVALDGNDGFTYGYYRIPIASADANYEPYGSKRKYLKALSEAYMTDNVARLLFRQEVCDSLMYYMLTDEDTGTIPTDAETIEKYLNGPDYINTLWIAIYKSSDGKGYDELKAKAESLHAQASQLPPTTSGDEAFRNLIIYNTTFSPEDTYMYRGEYRDSVEDAAFKLAVGDTTELIEDETGFYIIRRIPNDSEYIAENLDKLKPVYLSVKYYSEIEKIRDILLERVTYTDFYHTLNGTNVVWED